MISFNGYKENTLTFNTGKSVIAAGTPVKNEDGFKVNASTVGADFIGICRYSDEKITTVMTEGYVEMPYSDIAPSFGHCGLVSDGKGGVKVSSGTKHICRVLKVDTVNNIVGFII